MLLQIVTVFCLAAPWLAMAKGPQQLEPVKGIQKDINMGGTATEQQATAACNITNEITELKQKVNAIVTLIQPLRGEIEKEVSSILNHFVENITTSVESWLQPLLNERLPGVTPASPATSCSEIRAHSPTAPSGYYWIRDQDSGDCSNQRYCSMAAHGSNCSSTGRNNTANTQPTNESPGDSPSYPARSCTEIKAVSYNSPSAYYWLTAGNGSSIRMYCEMNSICGGISGGWMRMADINMTDGGHKCPQGLRTLTEPKRMCVKPTNEQDCASVTFDTQGIEYTRVCGKIIGYQYASTNAFQHYNTKETVTIDEYYMDGVVLTHGSNPRQHIWSFAAAVHEYASGYNSQCPCMNEQYTAIIDIPPWVRNDYFCDTGAEQRVRGKYYLEDPLWEGEGCGPTSTCCSFNNPPWFSKQLPKPTADDIEMRLCTDENPRNENLAIEKMELYVQ